MSRIEFDADLVLFRQQFEDAMRDAWDLERLEKLRHGFRLIEKQLDELIATHPAKKLRKRSGR